MPNEIIISIVTVLVVVVVLLVIFRKRRNKIEPIRIVPPENLLSYIPKTIKFESTRANTGQNTGNAKGANLTPKEDYLSTGVSFKSEKGKGSGTKSAPQKATTLKQRLNVFVSNLRRYFYHQSNIDDKKAEEIIDAKLASMPETIGYTKSQRREGWVYAPLKN
jgi:hypothetical protein